MHIAISYLEKEMPTNVEKSVFPSRSNIFWWNQQFVSYRLERVFRFLLAAMDGQRSEDETEQMDNNFNYTTNNKKTPTTLR